MTAILSMRVDLLVEHNALSETQVRARGYAETARAALDIFPPRSAPHGA